VKFLTTEGIGASVWIISPKIGYKLHYFKLAFGCTDNEVEYEALLLGLDLLRDLKVRRIVVLGDSKLVIKQVQGTYQVKYPNMRAYRNVVLDILDYFSEHKFLVIPREIISISIALAFATNSFKIPIHPNRRY